MKGEDRRGEGGNRNGRKDMGRKGIRGEGRNGRGWKKAERDGRKGMTEFH